MLIKYTLLFFITKWLHNLFIQNISGDYILLVIIQKVILICILYNAKQTKNWYILTMTIGNLNK